MKILVLSRWFPFPTDNGSKLRIAHLLKGLSQRHAVTLLSFVEGPPTDSGLETAQEYCSEVETVPLVRFNPRGFRSTVGFLSLKPRSILDTFSPTMATAIRRQLARHSHDVVIASEIDTAAYAPLLNGTPAIFDEAQVSVLYDQFQRADSPAKRLRYQLTWAKYRRYLSRLLKQFGVCTVASEVEYKLLRKAVGEGPRLTIIPNTVNVEEYRPFRTVRPSKTLVFTGSFSFGPNYEGMRWFLEAVYPQIQEKIPAVQLIVTGDHANRPIPIDASCTLTGMVPDIRPVVAPAACSLVPLFSGGGTRLKILEAMALGTPVVTTTKGAEGLNVQSGRHLLIADNADDFAHSVIRILTEPEVSSTLVDNSLRLIEQEYDWKVVLPRFLQLVDEVAKRPASVPARRALVNS